MGKGKGPAAAPETLGGTAIKPEGWDRTGLEAFKYFLYNPKTGEVLSRTPLSWFKITAFYIVYYSCLAGFWLACLNIFFLTLPENGTGPKWTMQKSLIGTNPGVGLRPVNTDKLIDSQMFVLKTSDSSRIPTNEGKDNEGEGNLNADYAARMRKFLDVYTDKVTVGGPYHNFDLATLKDDRGGCNEFPYGFVAEGGQVTPCIFIKFNKIWGWNPSELGDDAGNPMTLADDDRFTDDETVEDRFPAIVMEKYDALADKHDIVVNCEGRYAADKEAITDMMYFPKSQSISSKYFPYMGGKDLTGNVYHSPLVAVKLPHNKNTIGQLVHIECRAYYYGVEHDTKHKQGLVQFEVLISDK